MIHKCTDCGTEKSPDCTTCKLAFLTEERDKKSRMKGKNAGDAIDEDDYSISERLTEDDSRVSLLLLCVIAFATLALVLLFSSMMI